MYITHDNVCLKANKETKWWDKVECNKEVMWISKKCQEKKWDHKNTVQLKVFKGDKCEKSTYLWSAPVPKEKCVPNEKEKNSWIYHMDEGKLTIHKFKDMKCSEKDQDYQPEFDKCH